MMSKEYRVIWEIDIIADSPVEAAQKALVIQQDRHSTATVFSVISHSDHEHVLVDILDKEIPDEHPEEAPV